MASVAKPAIWRHLVWLLAFGAFTGCGDDSGNASVEGRVSYQDQAIDSGALTFYPAKGRPVTTVISTGGAYACQLPPGEYRVAVSVGVTLPAGWKEGDPVPAQSITLPAQYGTRLATPLTAIVLADQAAPIDFALN